MADVWGDRLASGPICPRLGAGDRKAAAMAALARADGR